MCGLIPLIVKKKRREDKAVKRREKGLERKDVLADKIWKESRVHAGGIVKSYLIPRVLVLSKSQILSRIYI